MPKEILIMSFYGRSLDPYIMIPSKTQGRDHAIEKKEDLLLQK